MILYLENLWSLFVDMSFYIVIGLIFTGLLHAFIKKESILKHVGKNSASSVVKASVLGVPLPLCSCGVVPTAMYLGKSGASKGAVVSFLTSTPQTGVDSIIATYGMLGPLFAVYRAVAAFFSGIVSGIVTNILCKNDIINYDQSNISCGCSGEVSPDVLQSSCGCSGEGSPDVLQSSCGCSGNESADVSQSTCGCSGNESADVSQSTCGCSGNESPDVSQSSCGCSGNESPKPGGCCSGSSLKQDKESLSFLNKMKLAFTYGFGEFLDEIAVHFIVGLLIAALISTVLPASLFANFSNPLVTMFLMVLVGIPMYICSTASIPIAVSLMLKGISPGAAFVFLFAGPVTNIASLLVLVKTLGKKVAAIYLSVAAVSAILFGLLFDYIITVFELTGITSAESLTSNHQHTPFYMIATAVVFGVLLIRSIVKQRKLLLVKIEL